MKGFSSVSSLGRTYRLETSGGSTQSTTMIAALMTHPQAALMAGLVQGPTVDDPIDAIMPDDIAKKLPHLRARHHLHATAP